MFMGFTRIPKKHWIDVSKSGDENDESPDGLYTSIIVPTHHLDRELFLIDKKTLECFFDTVMETYDSLEPNVKGDEE